MKIYLGTDHKGFEIKEELKRFLTGKGYEVVDIGNAKLDPEDDYPDFVVPVAQAVASDPAGSRGIVLGCSGQGEAMAANKVSGIRAVVYYGGQEKIIELSRLHNNANILSLGACFLKGEEAKKAVEQWLETSFSQEERHQRRINKISELENNG